MKKKITCLLLILSLLTASCALFACGSMMPSLPTSENLPSDMANLPSDDESEKTNSDVMETVPTQAETQTNEPETEETEEKPIERPTRKPSVIPTKEPTDETLAPMPSETLPEDTTEEKESLKMVTNAYFSPYEYYEGDKIVGIDIEIAEAIAELFGKKLEVESVNFDEIPIAVSSGIFDFGMAGITVTEERLQEVDFSKPYLTACQMIVVQQDSHLTSIDDLVSYPLDADGWYITDGHYATEIGVVLGTTGALYADWDGYNAVFYTTANEAIIALKHGEVEAVMLDYSLARFFVDSNDELRMIDGNTAYAVEEFAICVKKGNQALLDEINMAIDTLTANGIIEAIVEKYIPSGGYSSEEPPTDLPTDEPTDEPTGETESKEFESLDFGSYADPSLEEPDLKALAVGVDSFLKLSQVEANDAKDGVAVTLKATDVYTGSLILVNSENALKKDPADIKDGLANVYDLRAKIEGTNKYVLANKNIVVRMDTYTAFTALMDAAVAKNAKCSNILVAEGYRTVTKQQDLFIASDGLNVLKPNHSDFQTGYSLHLKYYSEDKLTYTLGEKKENVQAVAAVIADLADDYGFIQRYPAGKSAYTGVGDKVMPYLYRYVGVPHARVMTEGNYSLEEYIAGIKNYTESAPLRIEDGDNVYHVFYVAAAGEGKDTTFNVPKNHDFTWSGNNVDGFIVTVTVKMPTEEETAYVRDGDYIYFGSYPQSLKDESVTVSETTDEAGYYLGSDGFKYVIVTADPYRSNYTFSDGTSVTEGENYYFKVEPIRWRILAETEGEALLLCDSIIATQRYDDASNHYAESEIRNWLNQYFYRTAFTELQKELILLTTVDNSIASTGYAGNTYACIDTDDNIFLLSYQEVTSSAYGFNYDYNACDLARQIKTSDTARAYGVFMSTEESYYGNGYWWLRSPRNDDADDTRIVFDDGNVYYSSYVFCRNIGVVPALRIQLD